MEKQFTNSGLVSDELIQRFFGLALSLNHLNKEFDQTFNVSLIQLFVLLRLRDVPGSSPQELSGVVGVKPSTMTVAVQRLAQRNYVFVTRDPRDARRKVVGLTRKGNDAVMSACDDFDALFKSLNDGRGFDAIDITLKFLNEIIRALKKKDS